VDGQVTGAQQVIMEATGVVNLADPLGGSWSVEAPTDRPEAEEIGRKR
jgi:methylmalonyl-CoA mutase N-terminal domain/subunit